MDNTKCANCQNCLIKTDELSLCVITATHNGQLALSTEEAWLWWCDGKGTFYISKEPEK